MPGANRGFRMGLATRYESVAAKDERSVAAEKI